MSTPSGRRLDDLKNWAEIIQIMVVVLAILIGGSWTLYRFISLNEIGKARTELEKEKADLEKTRKESNLVDPPRAVLDVDLSADTMEMKEDLAYFIAITVTMKNKGTRQTVLDFSTDPFSTPLSITQVTFNDEGIPVWGTPSSLKIAVRHGEVDNVSLSPGETISLPFGIKVRNPGIYFLEFMVPQKGKESEEHIQAVNGKSSGIIAWVKGIFINVN